MTGKPLSRTRHHGSDPAILSEQAPSSRYVWYVIFLLAVVNIFNFMDRMALAVLLPLIKKDLSLSDSQLGLLIGFAFAIFYAVCGIPIARWADRGIRRNIIALALAIWSAMTALSGAAHNFWQLFAARVGLGAGEAGCLPPSQSLICDYVPPERRAGAYSLHSFGLIVGMMLGMALAGSLGELIGWRLTFVAIGLPGIALSVVIWLTLREPKRGSFDAQQSDESTTSFRQTLTILWSCRTYRLLLIFLATNGFVNYGLNQWWPSLYLRVFGLSLSSVGLYLGIAAGVGSGVGLLAGGFLANKLARRDLKLPLIVGAAAVLLALPVALASLFIPSALGSMILVGVALLLWSVPHGPVTATLYSVVQSRMRATAGALSIFFTSVLGLGLGPLCVGLLSDALSPKLGNDALRYALLLPTSLLPVMCITLLASSRTMRADMLGPAPTSGLQKDRPSARDLTTSVD